MTRRRGGTTALAGAAAVAVALALALTALVTPLRSASAQTGSPALVLAEQDAWVRPGAPFVLHLRAVDVPPGTTLVITTHDRVDSRSAFDDSVRGGALGPTRSFARAPFDTLPVGADGARIAMIPTPEQSGGGVYPLEVALRDAADNQVAGFVTDAIVADAAADGSLRVGSPLGVAWVWPIESDPAYLPDGTADPTVLAQLRPGGRLARAAAQIGGNDGRVPLTLAPSPETLDAWSTLANRDATLAAPLGQLRDASTRDEVVAGPFVPLDLPSILASGLGGIVGDEESRGLGALELALGTQLDPSVAVPGAIDPAALRALRNANVRRIVVQDSELTPAAEKFTPARPYALDVAPGDDSSRVSVLAADAGIERFLVGSDPPALRAARLLAALAVVAGEQPSVQRGVVIVNPTRWDGDDAFVNAVLAGLRTDPLFAPSTVARLFASVPAATSDGTPDGAPVVRQLASSAPGAAPVTVAQYARGLADQQAVANLVGPADPRAQRGERALAASVAAAWASSAGRVKARALLSGITRSVQSVLGQIRIPAQSTITITSSSSEIPVSLKNDNTQSVTVHVKLQSDRLLFPDGAERDVALPPGRSTTVRFAVETRSSGTAPVTMTVTTANGGLVVPPGPVRITVRSSFVSGVGLVLTIGAGVFLAGWWVWDIRRRRRRRGPRAMPAGRLGAPSGQPA